MQREQRIEFARAFRWLVLALLLSGCSKFHDLDALGIIAPGGSGVLGAGGQGGTSGTGGAFGVSVGGGIGGSGIGGTGGSGGGQSQPPISHDVSACSPCQPSMGIGGNFEACCTAQKQCGLDLTSVNGRPICAQQSAPGAQDMNCPTSSYMGIVAIPGCCGADGLCGIVIQQLAPLGCVHENDLGSLLIGGTAAGASGMGMAGGTGAAGSRAAPPVRCGQATGPS